MRSEVLAQFPDAKRDGDGWAAKCPAHDDHRASLSIGTGDDGRTLLHCHAGCSLDAILAAVQLETRDLFAAKTTTTKNTIVATYPYHDEGGAHLFDVVRFEPKDFRQRRADGTWKMAGVRRVLYRLRELQGQTIAYKVEGEKDADRLRAIGLPGTTNCGGAGKWKDTYAAQLKTAGVESVVVLPDNDQPGLKHAADVAASCHAAGLKVKIVALPDLPVKGDVSDWLDAGHTRAELIALVKASPLYAPSKEPAAGDDNTRSAVLVRLADVQPVSVTWLWPGRIPAGKLTLIVGDPGLGKSWITLDAAARTSMGAEWPDGGRAPRGDVILLSAEDALDDTIRPRLDGLGADVTRIHALTAIRDDELRAPVLARDLDVLERVIEQTRAVLVIVDPISAYLGDTDSHRDSEVRGVLAPLAALAGRTGAAIVGVMHLSKGTQRPAIYRAIGSVAFVAAARLVLAVAKHPEDDTRRVLAPLKSNICTPALVLAYRLDADRLMWDTAPVGSLDAEALLGGTSREEQGDQTDAERVIRDLLADEAAWPMEAKLAIEAGQAHGIPDRTMRWTARRLGIRIARLGFGRGGRWLWHRPAIAAETIAADSLEHVAVAPMASMQNVQHIAVSTHIEAMKSVRAPISDGGDDANDDYGV